MKKVELLAPAGSYESFLGAINAGADAVYLGGIKYGARAFAENFDEETLCRAIYYAHLFDRKVYMTLNTLMKQSELNEVEEFLTPFYNAGLDGVIVQDLGLLSYLKKRFPLLELHISTQMAVTGPHSVRMLKEEGAVRVVPARELSLKEMELLKKEGLEIETFIHGAMCYCYSGQCFFSSFLGGRSGNRGKCAQSCRLPYQVNLSDKDSKGKKEEYPLSLKDMCSIELVPELIKAGIDSFKIEGRMKRPEYVAGVTFGATTPSYDLEKEIDRFFPYEHIDQAAVEAALPCFIGEQDQIAPLFSAKSVDGVRAYELARKLHKEGKTLDEAAQELIRTSRITISELELLEYIDY